jgi:carbamoyl-phosphate synthase large subunit
MKICVTSIGSISGPFVTKRLKDLGHEVTGLNVQTQEHLIDKSYCDDFQSISHSSEEDAFIDQLLVLSKSLNFDAILPLTDPEAYLLSTKSCNFLENGIKIFSSNHHSLSLVRDKFSIFSKSKEWSNHQFKPIPTFKNFSDALEAFGLPIIAKPSIGRSSQGLILIETFNAHPDLDNYIYQPYLKGNIITVDAIRIADHNFTFCLPREELERTSNGAGIKVRTFKDPMMDDFINSLLERFKIEGCVNIEFIQIKDCYYLMDFNLRLSAGIRFSYAAGADFLGALTSCSNNYFDDYFIDVKSLVIS